MTSVISALALIVSPNFTGFKYLNELLSANPPGATICEVQLDVM